MERKSFLRTILLSPFAVLAAKLKAVCLWPRPTDIKMTVDYSPGMPGLLPPGIAWDCQSQPTRLTLKEAAAIVGEPNGELGGFLFNVEDCQKCGLLHPKQPTTEQVTAFKNNMRQFRETGTITLPDGRWLRINHGA